MEITSDEKILIDMSLAGNPAAFGQLFSRYNSVVDSFLFRLTGGNEFDSKDLLQETFVKAFLNLEKYNPKYPFSQWLIAIARNTFIDYTRRKGVKNSIINDNSDSVTIPYDGDNPEESIISNERRMKMENQISNLPEIYRRIIDLRYYRGASYEEIAQELDIPIGTVKTRIHRAKDILNRIITEYNG